MNVESRPRRVVAVLLAGGLSSRMGDFKQLMPYSDTTIVETCVLTLLSSTADEVVVVTGYRADEVESVLSPYPVRIVRNTAYAEGMSTSVIAGVRALEPGEAVMICLCDQPHLTREIYDAVLDAYRGGDALVVVPAIAGDTGHPVIFDSFLRSEILGVDPAVGLRSVTYANRGRTQRVPVDAVGVLDDIDTQEDYERLRQ